MDSVEEVQRNKTAKRLIFVIGAVVVVLIVVGLVGVFGKGSHVDNRLVTTTYKNANIKYALKFYKNSTQQLSNNLAWMTQGGKKHLNATTTVLTSPALGKYGTGVAIFIVPIPPDKEPLLAKGSCSDLPNLTQVATVQMQGNSKAVVCGQKANGKYQVEYLFQFNQHNMTYVGFVLMPYDWNQVTSSPSEAKAFLAYANLGTYNSAIKNIIGSIQVQ